MRVNVADAAAHQATLLDELEDFVFGRDGSLWQFVYERQHFGTAPQIAARNLTEDKWVHQDMTGR